MMDYAALATELSAATYAAFVAAGDDQACADALNAITDDLITIDALPRDSFLTAIIPAAAALGAKDAATQGKWDRLLSLACAASSVSRTSWAMLSAAAVTDGLLTQDDADAVFKRKGTRAEVLFGAGTSVSSTDISFALRGAR
jgi:hypothetical protein